MSINIRPALTVECHGDTWHHSNLLSRAGCVNFMSRLPDFPKASLRMNDSFTLGLVTL